MYLHRGYLAQRSSLSGTLAWYNLTFNPNFMEIKGCIMFTIGNSNDGQLCLERKKLEKVHEIKL